MASNEITREQLNSHRRATAATLAASTKGLSSELLPLARAFYAAPDEETRAPFRAAIANKIYQRIDRFRAVMTLRARDFIALTSDKKPEQVDPYPYEAVEARVRSAAVALFKTGDVNAYVRTLVDFTETEVNDGRFEGI